MTNIEKATKFGKVFAERQYETFQDPKMRGAMFTWPNFPNFTKRFAEVSVFMNFHYRVRNLPALKEAAGKAAFERAKELVKNEL